MSPIDLEQFEKALARACLRAVSRWTREDPLRGGDQTAVRYGALIGEIADEADLSVPQARRRLMAMQREGKVLRDDRRGGSTAWWPVGLAEKQAALPAPPPSPAQQLVSGIAALVASRQTLTQPAAVPARQHWSDVLGVARDCSTSDVRDAFRERLAAVPEHDLDAEQQRQRIRDAYKARLTEDGISE